MNDTHDINRAPSIDEFNMIGDDHPLRKVVDERRALRGIRRAAAVNAVQLARSHAGRTNDNPYTNEESDILVAVMDLLDKVAGQ